MLKEEIIKKIGFDPQNEKECLEAVKKIATNIIYINNPSEKIQLEAVKKNMHVIEDIKNPTEKVQLEVIKQDEKLFNL
jgi:hypothetical protein